MLIQGFDYYYITNQYSDAMETLDTLTKYYNYDHLNLSNGIKVCVIMNRKDIALSLLRDIFKHFNGYEEIKYIERNSFGNDSTSFKKYFGEAWMQISSLLDLDKNFYEAYATSRIGNEIQDFLAIDQFIRVNDIGVNNFKIIDSICVNQFCDWLSTNIDSIKYQRILCQSLLVMLRHTGQNRFDSLEKNGVFKKLLHNNIISISEYSTNYDYSHSSSLYYPKYEAFIERKWKSTGINTIEYLKQIDNIRYSIGLLPLEYCAFCIKHELIVPLDMKYNSNLKNIIFNNKK